MTDQTALPLFDPTAAEQTGYAPFFAVGERVGHRTDERRRGTVVQIARDPASGRNEFWVLWIIGPAGGPRVYTAAALCRLPPPSRDERRTERQAEQLAAGLHPLAAALGWPLRLHAEAAPANPRDAPGARCGGCRFRRQQGHHERRYAKCTADSGARITRGAGTDVRAWWPACISFEPSTPDTTDPAPASPPRPTSRGGSVPTTHDNDTAATSPPPATWESFPWPDWVPERIRANIARYWTSNGKLPGDWLANATDHRAPALGEQVQPHPEARRIPPGLYVHLWDHLGRLVHTERTPVTVAATWLRYGVPGCPDGVHFAFWVPEAQA